MAVAWDKYHIILERKHGHLLIGRGELSKSGIMKWSSKSPDRSGEIIEHVARKMRFDLDNKDSEDDKGYIGYNMPRVGKLILVKPGYEFEIKKK